MWQLKRLPPETAVLLLPGAVGDVDLTSHHASGALVLYAGGWHELKGDLEDEDESNWKRIYGDVLRPPRCASLLALLVAIGVAQIPVLGTEVNLYIPGLQASPQWEHLQALSSRGQKIFKGRFQGGMLGCGTCCDYLPGPG